MDGNVRDAIESMNALTVEEQAALARIRSLSAQIGDEVARLQRAQFARRTEVNRLTSNDSHPAVQRLNAGEAALFNARHYLQSGLMWLNRTVAGHEGF